MDVNEELMFFYLFFFFLGGGVESGGGSVGSGWEVRVDVNVDVKFL